MFRYCNSLFFSFVIKAIMKYLLESQAKVRQTSASVWISRKCPFIWMGLTFVFTPSLEARKSPGTPSSTWSSWTPGSRCSLRRGRCWDKWTRYEDASLTEGLHVNVRKQQVSSDVLCFWKQNTGKLRIGTYTGDLHHGTVYSGGEIHLFVFIYSVIVVVVFFNCHMMINQKRTIIFEE